MTNPLDETIKARAATDGYYAIAWALLKIASALEQKRRKQREAKPPPQPDHTTLIG